MQYFERDPNKFAQNFGRASDQYLTILAFIKAIRFISKNSDNYDIVLRPHPTENIEFWKVFLKDLPNVHVIREDSISAWVNSSFAVMHNACTTAFETTISKKPLITYVPHEQKYTDQLPNELGIKIKSEKELLDKVNELFNNRDTLDIEKSNPQIPEFFFEKIFIDQYEYAAEKIIKEWET